MAVKVRKNLKAILVIFLVSSLFISYNVFFRKGNTVRKIMGGVIVLSLCVVGNTILMPMKCRHINVNMMN